MNFAHYTKREPMYKQNITEEEEKYIRDNHLEITVAEMSKTLNVAWKKIYEFMGLNGLSTLDKTKKKKQVAEGMFDPDERDWMI